MTQEMLEIANKEKIAFEEQKEQEGRIQVCTLILYFVYCYIVEVHCYICCIFY